MLHNLSCPPRNFFKNSSVFVGWFSPYREWDFLLWNWRRNSNDFLSSLFLIFGKMQTQPFPRYFNSIVWAKKGCSIKREASKSTFRKNLLVPTILGGALKNWIYGPKTQFLVAKRLTLGSGWYDPIELSLKTGSIWAQSIWSGWPV